MKKLGLNEIRKSFLDFYEKKNHLVSSSYSLVPSNDKSLLLVNAGMQPMKNYFAGLELPPRNRMATCQKCIRTGDIDNVGITARHATFFEMLGNFSFGDYFKQESLEMGWEFLIDVLEMPVDKLWASVYHEDDEAYEIWKNIIKIPEERIVRLGKADNFWEIGTGPCGPCSEIYYDRGEAYGCGEASCAPGCECERFLEFWNHVFTQFHKDEQGNYSELKNKNIDTGMGLERIACLMQDVESIFEVDTMATIVNHVVKKSGVEYGKGLSTDVSVRILSDHVKAVTFLVSDGVLPNNEGRGYVLRRLLRRAARHGKTLGLQGRILSDLVAVVIGVYGESYPELVERADHIKRIIDVEEERFHATLDQGLLILNQYIEELLSNQSQKITGEQAFKLYDTFGFPSELTLEIAAEKGLTVDLEAFEHEMAEQKKRARQARQDSGQAGWSQEAFGGLVSEKSSLFSGYDQILGQTKVLALATDEPVNVVSKGNKAYVLIEESVFYPEGGGQVGDVGLIKNNGFSMSVSQSERTPTGAIILSGEVTEGSLSIGDEVEMLVDQEMRFLTTLNHSATHLLHKALKKVVGDHVEQAGSLVNPERLRFDFSHFEAMTNEQIKAVENLVNIEIRKQLPVKAEELPIEEAKRKGAMALFGEKYGDTVRVVSMGDFSIELCGGTHVRNTSEIGVFKIVNEFGVAAGVRRIEAITGKAVYDLMNKYEANLFETSQILKTSPQDLVGKAEQLTKEMKGLQRENEALKNKLASSELDDFINQAIEIKGIYIVKGQLMNVDMTTLRNLGDQLKNKWEKSLVVLANAKEDKVEWIAMASDEAVKEGVHAGKIIKEMATITGGGGGGKPNMAQAGGKDPSKISQALEKVDALI